MKKDPNKRRDRPEPGLDAHRAADPERASLAELRRKHGRDLAAWPAAARKRFERWEARQLKRKAEERAVWVRERLTAIGEEMGRLDQADPSSDARLEALRSEADRLRSETGTLDVDVGHTVGDYERAMDEVTSG